MPSESRGCSQETEPLRNLEISTPPLLKGKQIHIMLFYHTMILRRGERCKHNCDNSQHSRKVAKKAEKSLHSTKVHTGVGTQCGR